ncbi:hypothetical protein Tcan_04590 [Toxocara canis]|uniref:Uncharacterized protein n=1 Tax=Toxocara canis TaxID=6265 RepID=A0A0B2V766_TOXCA|nr:hypothetical protein Tcan_04590 [Toxocara canis]
MEIKEEPEIRSQVEVLSSDARGSTKSTSQQEKNLLDDVKVEEGDDLGGFRVDVKVENWSWKTGGLVSAVRAEQRVDDLSGDKRMVTQGRVDDEPFSIDSPDCATVRKKPKLTDSSWTCALDDDEMFRELEMMRASLPQKLKYNGATRQLPITSLEQCEEGLLRRINEKHVANIMEAMREGLWDWNRSFFTVCICNGNRRHPHSVSYIVQDGSHRLRAMRRLKESDSGISIPENVACVVYEELSLNEMLILARVQQSDPDDKLRFSTLDLVDILRSFLLRRGHSFEETVHLSSRTVAVARCLVPSNTSDFVFRLASADNDFYSAAVELLRSFSSGEVKISNKDAVTVRRSYLLGESEIMDLGKRTFWKHAFSAYVKSPTTMLSTFKRLVKRQTTLLEAETELQMCKESVVDVAKKMHLEGMNERDDIAKQLFGNVDIDDDTMLTVLRDDSARKFYRRRLPVRVDEIRQVCEEVLQRMRIKVTISIGLNKIPVAFLHLIDCKMPCVVEQCLHRLRSYADSTDALSCSKGVCVVMYDVDEELMKNWRKQLPFGEAVVRTFVCGPPEEMHGQLEPTTSKQAAIFYMDADSISMEKNNGCYTRFLRIISEVDKPIWGTYLDESCIVTVLRAFMRSTDDKCFCSSSNGPLLKAIRTAKPLISGHVAIAVANPEQVTIVRRTLRGVSVDR